MVRCYNYPEYSKKPFMLKVVMQSVATYKTLFYHIYIRLHLKDDIVQTLPLHLIELAPFFDPA